MNRFAKDYLNGGRNIPVAGSQHRRGQSLNGIVKDTDENLDLFSRNRRSLSVASSDESDGLMKLGKISVGSVKLSKTGMDDLLASVEGGKNDYDWLLTPPGTPLFSSSDASEPRPTVAAPKSNSSVRSSSTTKASRLSVTQSESSYSSRPARSSSVTRPSISSANYNTYSTNSNRSSNILNTSSSSVTSMSRPSTPGGRSSTARPSTPTGRSVPSRPSTPVRSRPAPIISSTEKSRPSHAHARPSTPTSRPQIVANSNSMVSRSNSRPSTPTRRNSAPGPVPVTSRTASAGRGLTNGRNSAPTSRGSSPGPRARPPPQPIVPPDFPLDTPPNLRTSLTDRPVSAGRSRPGTAISVRGNLEPLGPVNPPRRQPSPIGSRGRLPDLSGKGRVYANGHSTSATENQKTPASESTIRRAAKPATTTDSTGFGRTISKKSLDMALRHMDIRNGSGNIRPMSGTTLFPQSIRSGTPKGQHTRLPDPAVPEYSNGVTAMSRNIAIVENGHCNDRFQDVETIDESKKFANSVNIARSSVMITQMGFTKSTSPVIDQLQAANVTIYLGVFRNEYTTLGLDFYSDPIVELSTYGLGFGLNGVITDYPSTASEFKRSPCINPDAKIPIAFIIPDDLLNQVFPPGSLPPSEAPKPQLEPADVVNPPLPPVVKQVVDAPPANTSAASPKPSKSRQSTNVTNLGIFLVAMVVLSVLSLGY